jgi:hypothetical protein
MYQAIIYQKFKYMESIFPLFEARVEQFFATLESIGKECRYYMDLYENLNKSESTPYYYHSREIFGHKYVDDWILEMAKRKAEAQEYNNPEDREYYMALSTLLECDDESMLGETVEHDWSTLSDYFIRVVMTEGEAFEVALAQNLEGRLRADIKSLAEVWLTELISELEAEAAFLEELECREFARETKGAISLYKNRGVDLSQCKISFTNEQPILGSDYEPANDSSWNQAKADKLPTPGACREFVDWGSAMALARQRGGVISRGRAGKCVFSVQSGQPLDLLSDDERDQVRLSIAIKLSNARKSGKTESLFS